MQLVFTDQYANYLLLLNGIAILFYMAAKKKNRQRALSFGNYETLEKVAGRNFLKSSNIILLTRILALTFLIIGISSPVIIQEVTTAKSDYVIAIDSSSSMLASDLQPTRFQAAKTVSKRFVGQLGNGTKVGVVSFSGNVNKEAELTSNLDSVSLRIEGMQTGSKAGTAIGDALDVSSSMLLNNPKPGTIILITDGRNNVGGNVEDALNLAESANLTIHAIGIGEENRSVERFGNVDGNNATNAIFPNLDTAQLSEIANRTGGNFVTATNNTELRNAVVNLEQTKQRTSISNYFILAAAVLLLLEWLLGSTKYSVIP